MVARMLKAGMVALAVLTALSLSSTVDAADWHGGQGAFRPHGVYGHAGFNNHFDPGGRTRYAGRGRFWANRPDLNGPEAWRYGHARRDGGRRNFGDQGYRLGANDGFAGRADFNHFRRDRPMPLIRRSSSSDIVTSRGSGVTVILSDRPDVSTISSDYAGAGVYQTDSGTYATGFSSGDGYAGQISSLRPRARIIDTARAGDPCSHENGVCVIRGQ